jgi:hypothetical protein
MIFGLLSAVDFPVEKVTYVVAALLKHAMVKAGPDCSQSFIRLLGPYMRKANETQKSRVLFHAGSQKAGTRA